MFETIDNVTMINESTGAFPDAAHRPARRWPGAVLQGQYPLVLDALQAAGAAWHTAAPCLRPRLCIDLHDATCADELPSAQNVYNELKPVVGFIVAGELATTVKVGQELRGAGVGGSRRPLLPLGDGSRAALRKLLTYVQ